MCGGQRGDPAGQLLRVQLGEVHQGFVGDQVFSGRHHVSENAIRIGFEVRAHAIPVADDPGFVQQLLHPLPADAERGGDLFTVEAFVSQLLQLLAAGGLAGGDGFRALPGWLDGWRERHSSDDDTRAAARVLLGPGAAQLAFQGSSLV